MSSLQTADAFEYGVREVMTGNASAVRRLWYVVHTWNILLVLISRHTERNLEKIMCI